MASAQREFLVQRLMEDSQKMRNSVIGNGSNAVQKPPVHSSDSDEQLSDSSSDQGLLCPGTVLDSEKAVVPTDENSKNSRTTSVNNSLFANPLQYAATLASLAQMNFLQPAAAATLPLLYPHLYQSLLTMPNLERLRFHLQSPTEILSKLAAANQKTPCSTEKKLSSMSLTSPTANNNLHYQQSTPSPRKRSSSRAKNVDPVKLVSSGKPSSVDDSNRSPKKPRAIRRIQFDDEKSSPVSGMYIKDVSEVMSGPQSDDDLANGNGNDLLHESADFVKITEEAKRQLAQIPNVIGDFICQLCKLKFDDAFRLAMHKCRRIGHRIYRCPECEKVFSCPANLASHRRWHRPKEEKCFSSSVVKQRSSPSPEEAPITPEEPEPDGPVDLTSKQPSSTSTIATTNNNNNNGDYEFVVSSANGVEAFFQCEFCNKKFDSHRLLRSHAIIHTNFAQNRDSGQMETQCVEPKCELWFPTAESCDKHSRLAHPKFVCKFCLETYPTSPSLTRHINKCHPTAECRAIIFDEEKTSGNFQI